MVMYRATLYSGGYEECSEDGNIQKKHLFLYIYPHSSSEISTVRKSTVSYYNSVRTGSYYNSVQQVYKIYLFSAASIYPWKPRIPSGIA